MIYLHIGRARTGTSTIQRFLTENTAALSALDIVAPNMRLAHQVARSMRNGSFAPGDRAWSDLHEVIANLQPQQNVILSSETFHRETDASKLKALQDSFAGHDVRVLLYVRSFTSWLPSLYNQHTAMGRNSLDFDAFFDIKSSLATSKEGRPLRGWIDVFGAKTIRARAMPMGNALLEDFVASIGVLDPGKVDMMQGRVVNSSQHWIATEMARLISKHMATPATPDARHAFVAVVRYLVRKMGPLEGSRVAQYLTPEQWTRLKDGYAFFVDRLNASLGEEAVSAGTDQSPPPPRPFLPSFEAIPASLRDNLAAVAANQRARDRSPSVPAGVWAELAQH